MRSFVGEPAACAGAASSRAAAIWCASSTMSTKRCHALRSDVTAASSGASYDAASFLPTPLPMMRSIAASRSSGTQCVPSSSVSLIAEYLGRSARSSPNTKSVSAIEQYLARSSP